MIDKLTETLLTLQELLPVRCSRVASTLNAQPKWFQEMANASAISEIEHTYKFVVARSIRLFYQFPAYAVFLKTHHDIDVFLDGWIGHVPSAPLWTKTTYPPWLAIAEDPNSGMCLMVRLDCQNPEISCRYFETVEHSVTLPETFYDWLLIGARDTLEELENTEGCFVCGRSSHSCRITPVD